MENEKEYREQLVEQVSATGLYILKHADEIVDKAKLKTGFSIFVSYECDELPTIEISQSHVMREVMEVQLGKQQK